MDVYLRFVTNRYSIESALIRFATRSKISHVEFIAVKDGRPVYTVGSLLQGGVQIRKPDYDTFTSEYWFTAPGILDAHYQALSRIGTKYNWLDILGIASDQDWHLHKRFICSELVAWSFEQVRQPLLNRSFPCYRVTPRDLLLSTQLTFVKEIL